MNDEKLAKESRALFMKWVYTLTDDDIDKLLGIEKEKSLEKNSSDYLYYHAFGPPSIYRKAVDLYDSLNTSKHEKIFDANWEQYIVDALAFYIASEGWDVDPHKQARADYKKFKKQMRFVVKKGHK